MPGYRFGTLRPPLPDRGCRAQAFRKGLAGRLLLGAFIDGAARRNWPGCTDSADGGATWRRSAWASPTTSTRPGHRIRAASKRCSMPPTIGSTSSRVELTVFHDNAARSASTSATASRTKGVMRAYAFRDGQLRRRRRHGEDQEDVDQQRARLVRVDPRLAQSVKEALEPGGIGVGQRVDCKCADREESG